MSTTPSSFYDLSAISNKGKPIPFSDFKGKVVLVVNVASQCGFTKQYAGLEELNKKYRDRGLQMIGFPCNQFGGQEPGSAEEIESFCQVNFGVTFPLTEKVEVNGTNEHPVFHHLKSQKKWFGLSRVKWNFEKFLIDTEGNVAERFSSTSDASAIEPYLLTLLPKAESQKE
ncbi:hypothetical protein PROFUN_04854 [Planoprotostelium fungivorum]|nr:hypothetical protein PROFUN_04854 [Planoprotostelium fungivorum]